MPDDSWITTSDAARRLGLRRETLYAYVSRGILTSRRQPGQQESLFSRAEIDNLAATKRGSRRAGPDLLRFRAVATAVSSMDEDTLQIRGVPVHRLAGRLSFEQAAQFVLQAPKSLAPRELALPRGALRLVQSVPAQRRIPVACAVLSASDPLLRRTDVDDVTSTALGFTRLATSLVSDELDVSHPWIQALLVSMLDNGLTVSTVAARVAASSRAGVLDALSAGYGAMSGPLHGSAPVHAWELIADVLRGSAPRAAIGASLDRFGFVPGFGHIVYRGDDPRATHLLRLVRKTHRGDGVLAAVSALRRRMDRPINIDLMTAAVLHILGYEASVAEVIFQLGRTPGMAAHIVEEYSETPLRWRANNA
ncbi:helix-turn-helix domain-containing protein [Epidermidibacterium keratini]|uniref:citrate synthase (unknown stereospecificity) n=1 Tax=Epidermidibacterium keratini TaxID=1891644 RepID=A0A7L4YRA3_9ACTN|nr:citrate/2-methylcitrate synthase [Epidermidibacterium keratini]QHC01650.1 helix-turn-helix domain-containing protein [Epidermidibacterium keratini]